MHSWIALGDTGEKDEEAGERIARMYPKRIKAIFLHTVSASRDRTKLILPKDRVVNGVPILYFRTYVGAALKARNIGLIDSAGVARVINQARKELGEKEPRGPGEVSTRWTELEQDIVLAKKAISRAFFMKPFMS